MVLGVGLDVMRTDRMDRALELHGDRLLERVFTPAERDDCRDRADRVQALAARFAAKEACLKALGTGWAEGLTFRQVEVVRRGGSPPTLLLHGAARERADRLGVRRIHVSLTHQPGMAAAVVVLEGEPEAD